jgi:hypothetical protein
MKRNWTVKIPGYPAFSMVLLDGELDREGALKSARVIWADAEIVR